MLKKTLIYINYFYPGMNSGGQAKTVYNLINLIDNTINIKIVTRNKDFKSNLKYQLPTNVELNFKSKAKIVYNDDNFNFNTMKNLEKDFNNIIHCGFFEPYTYKNLLKLIFLKPRKKYIILPMGVFSSGAMRYKTFKKKAYILLFNLFRLFNKVTFAFSTIDEFNNARNYLNQIPNYFFLPDVPSVNENHMPTKNKIPKFVFISRIHPIKNLYYAIEIINKLNTKVIFDIYGPIENKAYWKICEELLNTSNKLIKWKYCGVIKSNPGNIFSKYDFFLFPTKGENFGHVIFESMVNGCIPIISNLTPWTEIFKKRLEFSCNLNDINCFVGKIIFLINNYKNINKIKLHYIKEAKIFYNKTYGPNYVKDLANNLL